MVVAYGHRWVHPFTSKVTYIGGDIQPVHFLDPPSHSVSLEIMGVHTQYS